MDLCLCWSVFINFSFIIIALLTLDVAFILYAVGSCPNPSMVDGTRDGQEYTEGETFKQYCFAPINTAVTQTCGEDGIWTPPFLCDYSK